MSLFQNSVINKYLKGLESAKVEAAWQIFTAHFHNPAIQKNIRNSKEEQYQGEFLIDLFVNVFGYVKNPTPDFNLTTELKNVKGAKKTDGAILKKQKAVAVIELKGTNTTDLSKVETQAFGYKNNQPGCVYVITSNFEKLRFYIDNAVDFEEFNLFQLSKERFKLLWLCVSSEYLLKNIPKQIKDESLTQEENVTKKLYKDYSQFRNEIFDSIQQNNPTYDKLTLFKKTQKLLDRFLFIFFAEDRLLLPPNSIRLIVNQWAELRDKYDEYQPLYNRFKKYFGYMNTGYKGQKHDIFAYNGGLFEPDDILDNITIDDDLLHKHTVSLSNYDFESEVSVNILGHIFEHSLNEIEEIQAELSGAETDKSKSKRKKDGVFYTPKYITKYIVDNTVGKLCEEKKTELAIDEAEYEKDRKGRKKATLKALIKKLEDYRNWLLALTICDPACGSGAFLNQALEFLINEHRYIDELNAKLLGEAMVLSDIENAILEHNLFGVDINEESVEIAKLSLWLRTAQKGRKLTSLNHNIKCGNSLIDDVEVAGEKAFNWEREFPKVFAKGGFDVVVGNPPYVRSRELFNDDEKEFFYSHFESISYQPDLYKLFIEKSLKLLKNSRYLSFITPSVFMVNDYDENLRKFLLDNSDILNIANTDEDIFIDASVKTVVFTLKRATSQNHKIKFFSIQNAQFNFQKEIPQITYNEPPYIINEKLELESISIIKKLNKQKKLGKEFEVKNGIKVRKDLLFPIKESDEYKPFLLGRHVKSFIHLLNDSYIHYVPENEKLFSNQAFRTKDIFEQKKLIVRQILGKRIITAYDSNDYYTDQTTYVINCKGNELKLKNLLCILNSKLLYFLFKQTFSDNKVTFPKVKRSQLLEMPLPSNYSSELETLANLNIKNKNILKSLMDKFNRLIFRKFEIEKLSKNLQNWHTLTFAQFIKELKKKKVKLSLSEEAEWEDYFESEKAKAQTIQTEIEKTDKEIDQMVYQLYGLTDEEIQIVEAATA